MASTKKICGVSAAAAAAKIFSAQWRRNEKRKANRGEMAKANESLSSSSAISVMAKKAQAA
jgi:hypothetical protein